MAGIGVLILIGFALLSNMNGRPVMFAAVYTGLGLAFALFTTGFRPGNLLLGGAITLNLLLGLFRLDASGQGQPDSHLPRSHRRRLDLVRLATFVSGSRLATQQRTRRGRFRVATAVSRTERSALTTQVHPNSRANASTTPRLPPASCPAATQLPPGRQARLPAA